MTYTAIPDTAIDGESILPESVMVLMRDNPIAIAAGDSGAPKIQLAAMDASSVDTSQLVAAAVGRSEIANSTTTSAGNLANNALVNFALNDWALFPMIHTGSSANEISLSGHSSDSTPSNPRFGIFSTGAANTYDVDHRWIISA